ncbi:MAG: SDR family oxidoreductase [Alphaproteobacteria bacterium]
MTKPSRFFCFGLGYTGLALARALRQQGWHVAGTCRDHEAVTALCRQNIQAMTFADGTVTNTLAAATHILTTAPPGDSSDPVLATYTNEIAHVAPRLQWAGYLSTTGVYGDCDGAWVDETAPLHPQSPRATRRVAAEQAWSALHRQHGLKLHIFRLAGIYGPGRSALAALAAGTARRIVKPGHVFSRIHLSDIVATLQASMARPDPGAVYNVCDDAPSPPQDVVAFASRLLGLPPPPEVPFHEADLSPMTRSFYAENKRVSNRRIKSDLGVVLRYPDYQTGLRALFDAGEGRA